MARTLRFALLAAGCVACGPSFQAIYENDARFEHCYALDESATLAMSRKAACWKDWKDHHTFGQTRDRVDYAASRYQALSTPNLPTDEAMMRAAPGEVDERDQLASPAPTNAFAPPPTTVPVGDGGTVADAGDVQAMPDAGMGVEDAGGLMRSPPGSMCVDGCGDTWRTCSQGCEGKSCRKCDAHYRKCAAKCVK